MNLTLDDIKKAEKSLKPVLNKTSLIKSKIVDNCELYLKPENLQVTRSFKIRGAYNKISSLSKEEQKRGVVACSSGNHAQGVAYACKQLGIKATICIPENAPKVKIQSTKKLGAKVVLVPGVYDNAYEKALELRDKYGYTFVHPFNDETIIAGQGTIGLEILKELKETDIILTSVGGGGLISGIALTAKSINPKIKVFGVQSLGSYSMFDSFAKQFWDKSHDVKTIADGIAVKRVGQIPFEYSMKYVDDILLVREKDIIEAMKALFLKDKLTVEGAGALPVAAVMNNLVPGLKKDSKVVCVLSGGNVDEETLKSLLNK